MRNKLRSLITVLVTLVLVQNISAQKKYSVTMRLAKGDTFAISSGTNMKYEMTAGGESQAYTM